MKESLLSTLKELIKLGVLKSKKKNKKNKRKKQYTNASLAKNLVPDKEKDPFQKEPFNPIDIYGMGPKRYKPFFYPPIIQRPSMPNFQQNTDALRLRDENRELQTRIMELKNKQEEQKKEQQKLSTTIGTGMRYIMNDIVGKIEPQYERGRVEGYVEDDNIDTPETYGSEAFKSQMYEPQQIPSETELPKSILKTPDQRGERPLSVSRGDETGLSKQFVEDEQSIIGEGEKSYDSSVGEFQTRIPIRKQSTIRVKRLSFEDTAPRTSLKSIQDEPQQEEEGISGFTFPKVPVPSRSEYSFIPHISMAKTKPTKSEVEKWKEWYLMLGLNDDDVLASNKRDDFVKPILQKLKTQYRELKGTDQNVLKSKDPRVVHQAIRTKQGY